MPSCDTWFCPNALRAPKNMSEAELEALVTRDSMIGTGLAGNA